MRFSSLALAAVLSLVFASPISEEISKNGAREKEFVPGVNIANSAIAGTDKAVKNSYIVVFKKDASDASIAIYEADVGEKLGEAPKTSFKLDGFKGYRLETDSVGLAKIASDPLVSIFD